MLVGSLSPSAQGLRTAQLLGYVEELSFLSSFQGEGACFISDCSTRVHLKSQNVPLWGGADGIAEAGTIAQVDLQCVQAFIQMFAAHLISTSTLSDMVQIPIKSAIFRIVEVL